MEFDSKLLTVVSGWITDRPPIRHGLSVRQILILLMLFQYLRVKRCLTENLIGWKGWGKSETLERGRKKGTKRITTPHRNCSIYWISQTVMNETVCDWQDCTWSSITMVLFEFLRYTSRYVVETASFGCVSILREDNRSSTVDFKRHSSALIHPANILANLIL